jgi:hypothetical protein
MTISEKDKKYFIKARSKFQYLSNVEFNSESIHDIYLECKFKLNRSSDTQKTLLELSDIFLIPGDVLEIILWFKYPNECVQWFEKPLFIKSAISYRSLDPKLSGLDPDLNNFSYEEITPLEIIQGIIRLSAGTLTRLGSAVHDDLLLNWANEQAVVNIDKDKLLKAYVHLVRRDLMIKVSRYCMIEDLMNYHLDDGLWEINKDTGEKREVSFGQVGAKDSFRAEFDSDHDTKIRNRIRTNASAIDKQNSIISELRDLCHTTPSFVLERAISWLKP